MKLSDLAFACYIYSHMTDYDSSYELFLRATQPELNFHSNEHLSALLQWLNAWGCRQFAKEYHALAAKELTEWYDAVGNQIFDRDRTLLTLSEQELNIIEHAYGALVHRTASMRNAANGTSVRVEVGPTGAAKILFAWRPQALISWDDPMRAEGKYDGSASSYLIYLRKTREHLQELSRECRNAGFEIANLPSVIGRPRSTLVKLMDEYSWVTISRKCLVPDNAVLQRWASWS